MTDASPSALGTPLRAFDAEAVTLARSLRRARLTVLVGNMGVGKSTLLVDGVLPLLRRRFGDEPTQAGGTPQGAVPSPDRRSLAQGLAQGELLHFVDRWSEAPDESQVRAADEPQAAGRSRFELAEAMSPAHLSAVSRRHGGARLLFVFDHFERLLEGVQHQPQLQRFVDAWAEVVQAPDLDVHFLVAIDEPAWPRLQAGFAGMRAVELETFRLRAGTDGQVLEPLRNDRTADAAAGPESSDADLAASFNQSLSQLATLAREERQRLRGFAASVDADLSSAFSSAHAADPSTSFEPDPISQQAPVQSARARLGDATPAMAPGLDTVEPVRKRDVAAEEAASAAAVAETERQADAWQRAEARSVREAVARAAESRRAAQAAAEREAAERTAEAERVAQAQRTAEAATAAQAERHAEAARQTEVAQRTELQRLEQSLAVAQAAAAREAQAREAAEAAARAAQAQRLAEAQQRAEAERRTEAARQVEAATAAEAQRLAQSLAAAEAAAAREMRARQAAEAAAKTAEAQQRAEAERRAEAVRQVEAAKVAEAQRLAQSRAVAEAAAAREMQARRAAEVAEATRAEEAARAAAQAQQRVLEERATAVAEASAPNPVASEAAAGAPLPDATKVRPARVSVLWGAAMLLGATVAVLWWPTTPTPPLVASAPMPTSEAGSASAPAATASPASASAAKLAAADAGRYSVLLASADHGHSRIARELAGALSTEGGATRVARLPDTTDPIAGLQVPGNLAIVRLDALRAARASAAPPLRVLTPLFPEAVLFVVRADSPLKYIHELRGRRLSIGPVQSDGSHTVRAIYRHLFGADMKEPERLDNDAALAELVAFRSIDAMAIIVPLPSAWWASLDPGTVRRLRLLTLDPRHPADRRLLQAPGTSVARVGTGTPKGTPASTPTVMSFLVASGEGDADVERLTAMANALCRELPRLRERGHPKWRELQPASRLDTGWPTVQSFRSVVSRCARR